MGSVGVYETGEMQRRALLRRLDRMQPRILAFIAPAGFGKTTLARQYLARAAGASICDAIDLRDDHDLAVRLLDALERENPLRHDEMAALARLLFDDERPLDERLDAVVHAWSLPVQGVMLFEEIDEVFRSPKARSLFVRLLARCPRGRRVAMCARESLDMHLTRFAAPHEIVVFRGNDLAFDPDEMHALFLAFGCDAQTIERVCAITKGWPVAVLLLLRFARERCLEAFLDRLDDAPFQELRDYLVDEVFSHTEAALIDALLVCAVVPDATVDDVAEVCPDIRSVDALLGFARESPFVSTDEYGVITVHPLVASTLIVSRNEPRARLVARIAATYERRGGFERAAELHLVNGDRERAARVLAHHDVAKERLPSPRFQRVFSALDHATIMRYPSLWLVSALARCFRTDMAALSEECEAVWRTLQADAPVHQRQLIAAIRTRLLTVLGRHDLAQAAIEAYERVTGMGDANDAYPRALSAAHLGRIDESEVSFVRSLRYDRALDFVEISAVITLGAEIARARGERAVEQIFLERAVERARACGFPNLLAWALAERAIGAWLASDASFPENASELARCVEQHDVRAFARLAQAMTGRDATASSSDLLGYAAYESLIAAAAVRDPGEARGLAWASREYAVCAASPFIEAVAAVVCAIVDDDAFSENSSLARRAAARCTSPALRDAVETFAAGGDDLGMLGAIVARFSRLRSHRTPQIVVGALNGRVVVDGRSVVLSGRELELMVALALRREPTARARLAAMVWPDVGEHAARNAFSVCLHRLRSHLGRDDVVVREGDGYRLHTSSTVDLWEIEAAANVVREPTTLCERGRAQLRAAWSSLRERRAASTQRWEWFEAVERRLSALYMEIARRLASEAIARGDAFEARTYAVDMIETDPYDESARELAIRASLMTGDRVSAVRQFRQYRETLLADLQCEPSPSLSALIAG